MTAAPAPITIVVPEYLVTEENLKELKETLRDHKGTADVRMLVRTRDKEQLVLLDASVRVEPTRASSVKSRRFSVRAAFDANNTPL